MQPMRLGPYSPFAKCLARHPLLVPVLAFGFGVAAGAWWPTATMLWAMAGALASAALLLLMFVVIFSNRLLFAAALLILCVSVGYLQMHLAMQRPKNDVSTLVDATCKFTGYVAEAALPTRSGWALRLQLQTAEWPEGTVPQPVSGAIRVYYLSPEAGPPLPGHQVRFVGRLKPVVADSGSSFNEALWAQGVRGVAVARKIQVGPLADGLYPAILAYRNTLARFLDTLVRVPRQQATAKALLLGERTHLGQRLQEAYRASGLLHVLALSGSHITTLVGLLVMAMGVLKRLLPSRKLQLLLALCIVVGYVMLTGAQAPVVRAGLFGGLFLLGPVLGRKPLALNILAASFGLQLMADPLALFQAGFQLSYAAMLGLLWLAPLLSELLPARHAFLAVVRDVAMVSVAAQVFLLPLTMFHFGAFPTYFLPANLFIHYPAIFATLLGFVALGFSPLPAVAEVIGWWMEWCLYAMNEVAIFFGRLPGATVENFTAQGWLAASVGVWVLLGTAGLERVAKRRKLRNKLKNRTHAEAFQPEWSAFKM